MFLLYLLYFSNFVFLFIDYKFSTFIWKFYHVINKSATVYPLAGNMFTACYLLYRVKILTISGTPLQNTQDHIHICSHHSIQDQPVICSCPHYLLIFKGKQQNRKQWKHVSSLDSLDHVGAFWASMQEAWKTSVLRRSPDR